MQVLYVIEQGAQLRLSGSLLTVWKEGEQISQARLPLLERVALYGSVNLSTAVIARLLDEGIECVFYTSRGRWRGSLEGDGSHAAHLRVIQARSATQPAVRTRAVASLVTNKVVSQRRVLRALRLPPDDLADWMDQRLGETNDVRELRGLEGYSTRRYFAALKTLLPGADPRWRRTYPAPDGVNALLGYGYAILRSRAHAAIRLVGLDPYLGFLHPPGRGRPALVLDIMEEFRAPLVDYTCWRLLGAWGTVDGWWTLSGGKAVLSDGAKRSLISSMETRLGSQTLHRPTNQRTSWQRAMELQVRGFASMLQGKPKAYRAVNR